MKCGGLVGRVDEVWGGLWGEWMKYVGLVGRVVEICGACGEIG